MRTFTGPHGLLVGRAGSLLPAGVCTNLDVQGFPACIASRLGGLTHTQHQLALLQLQLLCDGVEVGHASAPVLQLRVRPRLFAIPDAVGLQADRSWQAITVCS